MKLDLTHEARNVLENALDLIQDQIDYHNELKEELLSKAPSMSSSLQLYLGEHVAEVVVLINELKQVQFSLQRLIN